MTTVGTSIQGVVSGGERPASLEANPACFWRETLLAEEVDGGGGRPESDGTLIRGKCGSGGGVIARRGGNPHWD